MPNQVFYIDELSLSRIAGWIDDDGPVAEIEIEIDGRWVCTLSPSAYRSDLEQAQLGDGRRGF
jgi:hypothetical protein